VKKQDLIEFLRSTIEEDAIVSRLFNLFHLEYGYSIESLNCLIQYGVEKGYFSIENINNSEKKYKVVEWRIDNTFQEIIMNNEEKYIPCLFAREACVPEEFIQFVTSGK